MAVPYTFAGATSSIPLSQLDANFATAFTLGNTAIQLGNTVTTLNNMTLANVTISSGNVTITNVSVTTANVTTGNVTTLTSTNATLTNMSSGNVTITGGTINGTTLGATTAASANVTTLTTSSTVTLNGGTVNGVAYLNGSKVLTTGSALTFDGTNVRIGAGVFQSAYRFSNFAGNATAAELRVDTNTGEIRLFGDTNYFQTFYANNSEQMRLTSVGLAIGTSSPGVKLDVSGADGVRSRVVATSGGTSGLILSSAGNTAYTIKAGNADNSLRVDQDGTDRLTLASGGNLGLGVTPSAWKSTYRSYDVGTAALGSTTGVSISLQTANAYLNASDQYIYKITDAASSYRQLQGAHAWFTAPSGTAGDPISFGDAKMTLTSGGNLLVGTTTNNASGGVIQVSNGITFPATQSASSDANTLDDYEEGDWTPNQGSGITVNSGTFSAQGKYTKIGRLVTVYLEVKSTGTISISAGGAICTNLPFTASGIAYQCGSGTNWSQNISNGCMAFNGTATLYCLEAFASTIGCFFTVTYQV